MTEADPSVPLSNSDYNKVKWLVTIVLPAIGALYFGLAQIWGLPAAEQVVGTCAVLAVFLGTILNISSDRYQKSETRKWKALAAAEEQKVVGDMVAVVDPGGVRKYSLELNGDPENIQYMDRIILNVVKHEVP